MGSSVVLENLSICSPWRLPENESLYLCKKKLKTHDAKKILGRRFASQRLKGHHHNCAQLLLWCRSGQSMSDREKIGGQRPSNTGVDRESNTSDIRVPSPIKSMSRMSRIASDDISMRAALLCSCQPQVCQQTHYEGEHYKNTSNILVWIHKHSHIAGSSTQNE
jgi:hypothetical protein